MNESALNQVVNSLALAGTNQELVNRLSTLESRRITQDKELPSMDFLFRMFGIPCFPRGELVGITGKPKSGKTFITSLLMTLCVRSQLLNLQRKSEEPLHVLWFDTEQSDESTQDILRNRIQVMAGDAYRDNLFDIFNVRRDGWKERLPLLETAVGHYHPDLIILDGIRDLVDDINDGVMAQDVVEKLMHLASQENCCIVCILHQNKAAEDKNLRGFIGTELTHKAFEVYECQKTPDHQFSFSQQLTRKYDIYDTLWYQVDEHGIPVLASAPEDKKKAPANQQRKGSSYPQLNPDYVESYTDNHPTLNAEKLFTDALPHPGVVVPYKELQDKVMTLANIQTFALYDRTREKAFQLGIIVKATTSDGYQGYYRPTPVETSTPPKDRIGSAPTQESSGGQAPESPASLPFPP